MDQDNYTKTVDYSQWVKERYQEVQKILKEHEVKEDQNVIYEKKSKAMEILEEILEVLTKEICSTVMIAITHLNIGILQADMQDMDLANEYFTRCIKMMEESKLTPEGILPAISANNQMGILYAQKGLYDKARDFLETAEILYFKFTEDTICNPINMMNIMGIEEIEGDLCPRGCLEKLHTLTLYYLAQVSRQLDDKGSFALYCHRTLSKQLSQNKITQDLDYIEWALNAATISQYFVEHEKFSQARYHLAAASCILHEYHKILESKGTKEIESVAADYETYNHRSADVARCWAKYGIALLSSSKERLYKEIEEEEEEEEEEPNNSKSAEVDSEVCKYPRMREAMENLRFVDLEPQLEVFTNEITDKYLLDFADAKPVFLNVRKWLDKAMTYYTFENHASDYACIAQDVSQAYKYLAFYEMNEDRQAKMHKRRIDCLEKVIQGLSPRFYRTICREIWIELAEIYSEILDIKIDRLQASDEKPTVQMVAKIERLARSSIKHYQSHLNSLETNKSDDGVESFSDEHLHQALHSHFQIGRLYNKIITSDVDKRIENMLKSIDAHSFVVNYYDEHPDKQEELKKYEFIGLSREFVKLLPLTVDRLKQQQKN
ncbi:KIF1-binding protein homolog [Pseudomyrmex gracilis]|uniref:KIF1-binding protein homolog n=1 Tax=Pseudomyrmex gracilis TaxID=219809 RepID=UPI000994CD87|nr:KIF1-binding protein homolog [Pseudomyrmex gracilis]